MPTSRPLRSMHRPTAPVPLTQLQHFYAAHRNLAEVNAEFLWLVNHGLTREDLQRCIERRPGLWERYAGFLDALPSRESVGTSITTDPWRALA